MRPESTSVTYRPDLSALVNEYDAEKAAARFIGRRAAPIFTVPEASGGFPIMSRENFRKPATQKRAEGASFNRITGEFGKGTFDCEENGLEYPIDDRRRRRFRNLIDAEAAASRVLWYQLLMGHEIRVAALFSGGGFTNHNVTTAWTTVATAAPLDDIASGVEALEDKCGVGPEDISIVMPRTDFREFMRVTQVTDKIKYTYPGMQPSLLQPLQVAAMLGVKQVLVARSGYDIKEEGVAESISQIWTAGVIYIAVLADEGAPLEEPSAARTMMWDVNAPELPVIESYREEKVKSDIVRARMDTDEVLIGEKDLFAYKLTNT